MAVAEGILDIALDYAGQNDARRVTKVALLLGEMAGVEKESLAFCWEALTRGTIAEGAALALTTVPLAGRCQDCGREGPVERYHFICPDCGGTIALLSGRELRVDYLEMD